MAKLRAKGLDGLHFRRQQVIGGYIVDFYCHAAALVVEVDGDVHRTRDEDDAARDAVLERVGLAVLRVPAQQVEQHISAAIATVRTVARERVHARSRD